MASIAHPGPVTASPPAKTPFKLVSPVFGSTRIVPSGLVSNPLESISVDSLADGRNNRIRFDPEIETPDRTDLYPPLLIRFDLNLTLQAPFQWPFLFSPIILTGRKKGMDFDAFANGFFNLSGIAGISSRDSIQKISTSSAPRRVAERATSRATFPPPMTAIFLPDLYSLSQIDIPQELHPGENSLKLFSRDL